MLLLDRYFFFARDFCRNAARLAQTEEGDVFLDTWSVWEIADHESIGDLHGAIRGTRFEGFIGATYRRFPFPALPEGFRQQPEGEENRALFEEMIAPFGRPVRVRFQVTPRPALAAVGDYAFSWDEFGELLRYVWLGGYPRWRDGVRPRCVLDLAAAMQGARHPLLGRVALDETEFAPA